MPLDKEAVSGLNCDVARLYLKEKRIKIKGLGAFKWLKYALSNIALTTGRVLGV